jgi:tetratricopeptide (TPR) repeat protein
VIPLDKPPYPGLRSFERGENRLFFGRDGCVDQMLTRLAERRFLAVLGSSGTGKSSLVKTGLYSALEMGLLSGAESQWLIAEFRPGDDPIGHLARALLQARSLATKGRPPPTADEITALRTRFRRQGPRELIKWCEEGNLPQDTNLLIVADQFEELFRQSDGGRESAQAFVSLLLESRWPRGVNAPGEAELPIYVTITMRSEYLGACALIHGLAEAVNEGTYLTPRMKRREVEEAIVGPARVCGFEVEPRLVNRLLNDMADFAPWDEGGGKDDLSQLARRADQLPLMQHALNQMWRRAREQQKDEEGLTLKLADYHGLEPELDAHAEEVYGKLNASVRPTAECVFRAVTSGTTVSVAVRRPTKFGELVDICGSENRASVAKVIAAFGPHGCQFLTSDLPLTDAPPPENARIDIAHESLIRQWKRLSKWLVEEGGYAASWRRLRDDAQRKNLLYGQALSDAVSFRKKSQLTDAWASRYGGDFKNVTGLIKKSVWHRRLRYAIGVALLAAVLTGVYFYRQKNEQAKFAAEQVKITLALAVSSAQQVLDRVSKSITHGDMTVNGASEMLSAAEMILHNAHNMDPTHDTVKDLVKLQHSFSDLYNEVGNMDKALKYATDAKKLVEPLRQANPDNPEILQSFYGSIWRVGDAISYHGHQRQALAEYEEAQRVALRLAEMAPGNSARQRDLMFIGQKVGDGYLELGDYEKAMSTFRTAWGVIEKVAAAQPGNRGWRRDIANSRRRIAQVFAAERKLDAALEEFNAAIEILTDLDAKDFRDTVTKSNLATAHRQVADVYAQRGDLTTAAAKYASALAIQEQLIALDPENATSRNSLASLYMHEGDFLNRRQKDLPGALARYRKAYDIRNWLWTKDPTNPVRHNNLAKAAIAVADVLTAQKADLDEAAQKAALDEAVKLYRRAIDVQELVLPLKPRHDDDVFDCYIKIGDIRLSQDDLEGARTEYTRAWSIANNFADQTSAAWQKRLMTSYIKIADVLVAEERVAEARSQYQEALKIATDLALKNPQSREWLALSESLKAKIQDASGVINAIIQGPAPASPLRTDEKEEAQPR